MTNNDPRTFVKDLAAFVKFMADGDPDPSFILFPRKLCPVCRHWHLQDVCPCSKKTPSFPYRPWVYTV